MYFNSSLKVLNACYQGNARTELGNIISDDSRTWIRVSSVSEKTGEIMETAETLFLRQITGYRMSDHKRNEGI